MIWNEQNKGIRECLLEMLRVGCIQLRNSLVNDQRTPADLEKDRYWSQLLHGIPTLLGECKPEGVRYFLRVHADSFLTMYPSKEDVHYRRVQEEVSRLGEFPGLNPRGE